MTAKLIFQSMANRLMNSTFASLLEDIIFTEQGDYDYATQSSTLTDTPAKGIRIEYSQTEIDGQKIQSGDYQMMVQHQGLVVDVRADNLTMTVSGISVSIVDVDEDAAEAAYLIQVREK